MSNGNQPETPQNGMVGTLARVAQGTAVGAIIFLLCMDIIFLAPSREARFQAALQFQQQRADERYDSLLEQILESKSLVKRTGEKVDKLKQPDGGDK